MLLAHAVGVSLIRLSAKQCVIELGEFSLIIFEHCAENASKRANVGHLLHCNLSQAFISALFRRLCFRCVAFSIQIVDR